MKLYIPPPRPGLVPRPQLIERLNEALASGCKLTLISASTGFGWKVRGIGAAALALLHFFYQQTDDCLS